MIRKLNIIYFLIVTIGAVIFYQLNFIENFFLFLAITAFGYTVLLLNKINNKSSTPNSGFEKNRTLFISQLIFLLITIGLRLLELYDKQNGQLFMLLQMTVVLLLMNAVIANTERKFKNNDTPTKSHNQ